MEGQIINTNKTKTKVDQFTSFLIHKTLSTLVVYRSIENFVNSSSILKLEEIAQNMKTKCVMLHGC